MDEEILDKPVVKPPHITVSDPVFSLDFHSTKNIVASGLITGDVYMHNYAVESNTELFKTEEVHNGSCRDIKFSTDGNYLFSCSSDKSLNVIDVNTGANFFSKKKSHDTAINSLTTFNTLLITGDDNGLIKIWDMRQAKELFSLKEHIEFISQLNFIEEKKQLLATGGDGYLSVWDVRKPKLIAMSDNLDDELLSMAPCKNNKKLLVGTQTGVLGIFNWDDWGDIKDRFIGHKSSVDSMIQYDQNILCTGSSDGKVRVINVHPNRILGILGSHSTLPVECIKIDKDNHYLASCSHDNKVKFWSLKNFFADEKEAKKIKIEENLEVTKKDSNLNNTDKNVQNNNNNNKNNTKNKNNDKKRKNKKQKIKQVRKKRKFFDDLKAPM